MFNLNLDKAKNIWIEYYRSARTPILKKLDNEYIRALEENNEEAMNIIKNKKQELRDITTLDLSDITHPDQLKNKWPEILGPNPFKI